MYDICYVPVLYFGTAWEIDYTRTVISENQKYQIIFLGQGVKEKINKD